MVRVFHFLAAILVACAGLAAELPVDYEIDVELNPRTHQLQGTERIRWTNTGGAPTTELWFHLYLNAFANDHTTFMRGLGEGTLRGKKPIEHQWGWTRVVALRTENGTDLLPNLTFERPDDGNPDDFTVARVLLEHPVEPGSSVTVNLTFEAQLPSVFARTGWASDFHLVGQWFPKIAVFEAAGHGGRAEAGWNCHQFFSSTEFYADFARYRVQLTVPDGFVVAATGIQLEERRISEGDVDKRTVTFTADRVHDFAWCAAPSDMMTVIESDFNPGRDVPAVWLERARILLGLSSADLELPPVHLRLLLPKTQIDLADRMLVGARLAIAWYGLFYGPYPFPQLTIVSPPPGAEEAAGMEYPTFITSGASKLLQYPPLSWLSVNENVTVHEFGHQYFQGLLASNEAEQAWLDEGLTSFSETSCVEAIRTDGLIPEIRISAPWSFKRLSWSIRESPLQIDHVAWGFRTRRDYGTASYQKSALALKTLQGLIGPAVFARAMRSYYETWRFRHPTGEDFRAAFTASSGEDLSWFFSQALDGDSIVDWAVAGVIHREKKFPEGLVWDQGQWIEAAISPHDAQEDQSQKTATGWTIQADIERRGDFRGPVEIWFSFADGREERRIWHGQERWTRFEFESAERLASVIVDPDGVWALEGHRRDNYWRDEPATGASRSKLWWVRAGLRLLGHVMVPWS